MAVNNKPIPFEPGNVGFVVPGAKVSFNQVGEGTHHYKMSFGLVTRTESVTIPAVADLGEMTEVRRSELTESYDWLHISIMRGLAFAFNVLWSIARPLDAFRKSDLVFDAEAAIIRRLSEKISVGELAAELGISHSHLLRLFREEHSCTIQEYIREKRADIARQLITETDLTLKEIAVKTGMADLQYFNKVMRAHAGLSPRALRDQALLRTRH